MQLGQYVSAEKVGEHWLVVSHRDNTAHHLSGPAAAVIDCVINRRPLPQGHDNTVTALINLGILEPTPGWSRRQVITTAAAATIIGVTTIGLPSAAIASSSNHSPDPGPTPAPPPDPNLGITWSPVTVNNRSWYSVAHGNGVWIAVSLDTTAGSTQVMRSVDDGVSWGEPGVTQPNPAQYISIAYASGRWVAVDFGNQKIITSTNDGLTWSEIGPADGYTPSSTTDPWTSVASNGKGTWIAVANNSTNENLISTDNGVTWGRGDAGSSATNSGQLRSVASGMVNGQEGWVAVGNGWRVVTSIDGKSWNLATSLPTNPGSSNNIRSVAYGNGSWVAVAQAGRVLTSTDGNTWTVQQIAGLADWQSVAFGNGRWAAVASSGSPLAITSTNGTDWTSVGGIEANLWRSVAYGNGVFVAVSSSGTNRVMRSPAIPS